MCCPRAASSSWWRATLPEGLDSPAVAALLADPAHALIVCDVDGTLAPIVELAADARAEPAAVAALSRLSGRVGRIVLLTGRPALVAVGLGAFAEIPGLLVLGHYGLDRWYDGNLVSPPPDPAVAAARAAVPPLPPGAYVEDKGLSFVVHTRPAEDPAGALASLDPSLRALAAAHGLEVVDGSYAREIRPRGIHKGSALQALLAAEPASAVLYFGDDDGDLPAAEALGVIASAGTPTLLVCAERVGGSAALREKADAVVPGVSGVVSFLDSLAGWL